jgi:uncharacterized membrane protein YfcA
MFKKTSASELPPYRNRPLAVLSGFGIGLLGGMFGLGSGFLYIPVLLRLFRIQPKPAVGTSLALAIALASGALIAKSNFIHFPWLEGAALAIGGSLGAQVGFMLNRKMNTRHLKKVMAVFILFICVKIWSDVLLW